MTNVKAIGNVKYIDWTRQKKYMRQKYMCYVYCQTRDCDDWHNYICCRLICYFLPNKFQNFIMFFLARSSAAHSKTHLFFRPGLVWSFGKLISDFLSSAVSKIHLCFANVARSMVWSGYGPLVRVPITSFSVLWLHMLWKTAVYRCL